jgi:hypothetical protein
MRTKLTMMMAAAAALTAIVAVTPAQAHHAFAAEFDGKQPIKLRGTVSKIEFINPHSWVHVDVKGDDGKVTTWMIEGGSPNTLFRRGVTQNSLALGTEVIVDGYRAKDGSNKANGRDITLPDGRKLFLGSSSGEGAPYQQDGKAK